MFNWHDMSYYCAFSLNIVVVLLVVVRLWLDYHNFTSPEHTPAHSLLWSTSAEWFICLIVETCVNWFTRSSQQLHRKSPISINRKFRSSSQMSERKFYNTRWLWWLPCDHHLLSVQHAPSKTTSARDQKTQTHLNWMELDFNFGFLSATSCVKSNTHHISEIVELWMQNNDRVLWMSGLPTRSTLSSWFYRLIKFVS